MRVSVFSAVVSLGLLVVSCAKHPQITKLDTILNSFECSARELQEVKSAVNELTEGKNLSLRKLTYGDAYYALEKANQAFDKVCASSALRRCDFKELVKSPENVKRHATGRTYSVLGPINSMGCSAKHESVNSAHAGGFDSFEIDIDIDAFNAGIGCLIAAVE